VKISNTNGILVALLLGAALAWFLSNTNTGAQLIDGNWPSLPSTSSTSSVPPGAESQADADTDASDAAGAPKTRVYRWRDARGNLNVSTEPPPPGTRFEIREYRDDLNVVPSGGGVVGD